MTSGTGAPDDAVVAAFAEHVHDRDRWARSARGPLALVNAQHVDHLQPVWPVPGTWAPAVGGLTVTAEASDGVVVDGVPVDGTVLVAGDTAVVPSTVALPDGFAGTVSGDTLRVWDPSSEAIARFAWSGDWVTSGTYVPLVGDAPEARGSVRDAAGDALPVAGHVETVVGGAAVRFVAVRSAAHRGAARLQLIVQDATSALSEDDPGSTYSMGRFLYLNDPGAEATVELDWNRLVLPPCAFSYQYACPIPPEDNRVPVPITAGERHPVDANGAVLH
ncbi:DUF1684 domain-containing protein [Curtobacterium flaccumfaciens pv. flaccumfaciens]|uniref:DUF1684 domain-containing protein n=1 Tax=Curtobacterium flaccumfaciens TaxID=2035 RepID=UPI0026582194|nr:DUF1684 domain-containing protein [Curtobacterium flaccumfaciens]MCS5510235.1 DUF1684 domain-containing protein [Curtobacterium flaccumfaciens pv. flaccumfaciens]MCX2784898.1 DUF1684 domain-containing protein [Curtobacterium flaccumfaciens pv. flaccumfaciens]